MNEKNGDVNVLRAERARTDQAERLAQITLFLGLTQRLVLCYSLGEPSIVDLNDAHESLLVMNSINANLRLDALQRAKDGVA